MDLSTFHNQFREETGEQVRVLVDGLLALEQASDPAVRQEHLAAIFRAMHTVKGSARMLGFESISRLAHALEHQLGALRSGRRALDRDLTDLLLRSADALESMADAVVEQRAVSVDLAALLQALQLPEELEPAHSPPGPSAQPALSLPAPQPAAGVSGSAPSPARQTIRVRIERLDRMLNLAGELMIGQQAFGAHLAALQSLADASRQSERALRALECELERLRFSPIQRQAINQHLAALRHTSQQTSTQLDARFDEFERLVKQSHLMIKALEQEVMEARLVPIATLYAGLPRAVRDLAQATGKDVRLDLQGEATELDRRVLEMLNDPLLHLVRNAVDHGIEVPDQRVAAGKPAQGALTVQAQALGNEVRVTVRDDGRGLDPQALRRRAVQLGLLSHEQASELSDADAYELIFAPGLSTVTMITDISGRGVGMDLVRANLLELGGQIMIETAIGQGTTFVLVLPLTLVTTRVLLVQAGGRRFALPVSGCRGTVWWDRREARLLEGRPTLYHDGRQVMLLPLAELLQIDSGTNLGTAEQLPVVLIGDGHDRLGLLVDTVIDEREVVVKSLGALFAQQRLFVGAAQLGDGRLVLLLNSGQLCQQARGAGRPSEDLPAAERQSRLLVVDDSFTTRELLRSILQSAGFAVTVAVDGMDALDKLRTETYDLVVSDVEMPRVNGFQLTHQIRRDPDLIDLPVILVTSLASESHRRQGLQAGAQAYIVKSEFNQDGLLDVLQRFL
jgi:chemotaxis protein histidine kinase CheA